MSIDYSFAKNAGFTAVTVKITAFFPEDGGSNFFRKVRTYLQVYTT
jgi:hypothetical protein